MCRSGAHVTTTRAHGGEGTWVALANFCRNSTKLFGSECCDSTLGHSTPLQLQAFLRKSNPNFVWDKFPTGQYSVHKTTTTTTTRQRNEKPCHLKTGFFSVSKIGSTKVWFITFFALADMLSLHLSQSTNSSHYAGSEHSTPLHSTPSQSTQQF